MRLALDTNAYSDFVRGVPDRVTLLRQAIEIYVPFVVLGELRAGFAAGNQGAANEISLQRFLQSQRTRLLCADDVTTRHYGMLFSYLRQRGTPIPTNDLWIAALVFQHGLLLCTSDAHFQKLPQIAKC